MIMGTASEYTLTYRDMLGVDFSTGAYDREKRRYAYIENMYRDYEGGNGSLIESVPGFRKIASLGGKIHAIYSHKNEVGAEYTVVHAGKNVFRFETSKRDSLPALSPIAEMRDTKSTAFRFGTDLYVLDGTEILKISADGTAVKINSEDAAVYVPTTFYNDERIEQRNLLTDRFREKYMIGAAEMVIYGSPGILYRITDEKLGLCAVVGVSSTFSGILNIPSYAKIGTKRYKVDEISDNAFLNNQSIVGIRLGIGIYRIGKFAFSGCSSLSQVYAYNAPVFIDDYAFKNCASLSTFYLGGEIQKVGDGIFDACEGMSIIRYASDEKNFSTIENCESLSDFVIYSFQKDLSLTLEIPINTPLSEIISVSIDGEAISSYSTILRSDGRTSVIFSVTDRRSIEGKEVEIYARADNGKDDSISGVSDFFFDYEYTGSGFDIIAGCTLSESFDGRVFVSGNPSLPGMVFFSTREKGDSSPLYFGAYNYFCDGFGTFGVSSMLSSADSLLVFKNADDGGGSIFYHTPKDTSIDVMPRIYPVSYTHNGIGAIGSSISFFDDPIFISKAGISAIDKKTLSLERSIACRSHNVNADLLSEDLSKASLAEWCGYLAVGINGKIYLADSRATFIHESGYREYEWYYMRDVGTYENATRVYRFSSTAHPGYNVHANPESEPTTAVLSSQINGETVYYTVIDGKKYELYATQEKKGGIFHPLTTIAGFEGDLLFFGTDNGDLCIFNNDKRGVAPDALANADGFDADEYKRAYGRTIHKSFYTFDTHSMRCGVRTAPSDCSLPGLTKNTVKHSLTLKCRLSGNGKIRCEAKTDRSGYIEYSAFPNNLPDFSDWCFASLTLDCEESISLPISEKEKNWIDKELAVYCDDFRSPIGIYSISYRYTPKGRIKHK